MGNIKNLYYTLVVMFLISLPSLASTTNGSEFNTLYSKMIQYVTGIPGIMFAVAVMVFSVYMSFFAGKGPMFFFAGIIAAAAIFIIPTIANGMGGAIF